MFTPTKRSDADIKQQEAELEELKKQRDLLSNPEATPEEIEAEQILADENANPEDKNWAKRYKDTKSHYDKKVNELNKRIQELEQNAQPAEATQIPQSVEELEQLRERDPEVVTAVEALAAQIAETKMSPVQERLAKLEKTNNEQTIKLAQEKVRKAHPDFDKINGTQEFFDWVEKKGEYYSNAVYGENTDPNLVIDTLTLYKAENGLTATPQTKPTKQNKADAAKMVATSKGTKVPDTSDKYMKESDLLKITDPVKFKEELSKHKSAGTLLYGQ